jgi:hypothetical protein
MDLAELRATVLDYLDLKDELESFPSPGQLVRIINIAYLNVVGKVEIAAPYYNVSSITPLLTTPASSIPREYDLGSSSDVSPTVTNIRKIVDCARRTASGVPYSLRIVDFAKRNAWLGRPGDASNPVPQSAVYFYRNFVTANPAATWLLGFVDPTPPASTVFEVRYLPDIVVLSADADIPHLVPQAWHFVIALRAAILGKGKENRNVEVNAAMYAEALSDMQPSLSRAVSMPQVEVV